MPLESSGQVTPRAIARERRKAALSQDTHLSRLRSVLAKRNGAVSSAAQFTKPVGEIPSRLRTSTTKKFVHGKSLVHVKAAPV
jgi:hypothetical protein